MYSIIQYRVMYTCTDFMIYTDFDVQFYDIVCTCIQVLISAIGGQFLAIIRRFAVFITGTPFELEWLKQCTVTTAKFTKPLLAFRI